MLIRLSILALAAVLSTALSAAPLSTVAERSGFVRTGRYAEVETLCRDFAKAYPRQVRCTEFGRTPQGRPMLALVATNTGALSAAEAHKKELPVLMIQGGIHAGEIDGKDAGFLALREVLEGKAARGALDKQVLVFIPVFNVDGHERFGAWNRPNQRGPEEMGWRVTAQNYNLNRDYAKADAPEMQAMLRLVDQWDPLALIDLHVTDGAKFEHDISITAEPVRIGDPVLQLAGRALRNNVIARLTEQGSLPVAFYPSFRVDDDPTSGIDDTISPPRFSTGYFQLRNRFAMLVETHSWKDYPTRVRITHNTILALLEQIAVNGKAWREQAMESDARAAHLAGQSIPLSYKVSDKIHTIDFRGYAYTREPSEVSGALMTHYDESQPQVWKMPLRDEVIPDLSVVAPLAGYLVPAEQAAWLAEKLRLHGISFRTLMQGLPTTELQVFRAETAKRSAMSNEGHQTLSVTGHWAPEKRELGAGALFVPIAQAKARLVMALLEPQAPDSYAAWGFFNNQFEQKEYMEAYVAEEVARAQMAADPALAEAFKKRVAEDAAFAKDPRARLAFFARRHSSWDERLNLYPVLRTDAVPR